MSAAQLLRQADVLKTAVADTTRAANEVWSSRQCLQDIYQKLLVIDLEFALDKKVEQDLWNHAFKNQISTLQNQVKDKQNPKRGEIQASLNLFLETASGFYLQLLQQLCSAFSLDLPFRRKPASLGVFKEYGPVAQTINSPKRSSCLYVCQHCLVHLGDIARYRQQIEQAQTYYRHAANLVPYNGQPYNQLAILEAAKGNKLSTVFYYLRSIAVKHPFPVASTNLEKFYVKTSKEVMEFKGKLSMSEIVATFLQFHAFVHLCTDLTSAQALSERLVASLPTHITSMSFSSYQLIQIIAINLFALHHTKKKLAAATSQSEKEVKDVASNDSKQNEVKDSGKSPEKDKSDQEKAHQLVFNLNVSVLELLLQYTPKQESKAKEYHTLAAIKILADWLRVDKNNLSNQAFKNSTIWPNLSKLVNNLQFPVNQKDSTEMEKYAGLPLPEDSVLQCFVPIQKAHSALDFKLVSVEGLSSDVEVRVRCHRIIEHVLWICDEFPSLNLLNVQRLKSGRLQFSAPVAHVRMLPGDRDTGPEKKPYRQNVAIQAIMQNKAKKIGVDSDAAMSDRNDEISVSKHKAMQEKENIPSKLDAASVTHVGTDPPSDPTAAFYHKSHPTPFPQNNKPITIKPRPQQPNKEMSTTAAHLQQKEPESKHGVGFMPNAAQSERNLPEQKMGESFGGAHGSSDSGPNLNSGLKNNNRFDDRSQSFNTNINLGPIGVFAKAQPPPMKYPVDKNTNNSFPDNDRNFFQAPPPQKDQSSDSFFPRLPLPNPAFPPPPLFTRPPNDTNPNLGGLFNFPSSNPQQDNPKPKLIPDFPNLHIPKENNSGFNFLNNTQMFIPPTPNSDQMGGPIEDLNKMDTDKQPGSSFSSRLTPGVVPGNQPPMFPVGPPNRFPPSQGAAPDGQIQMSAEQAQAILTQLFTQAAAAAAQQLPNAGRNQYPRSFDPQANMLDMSKADNTQSRPGAQSGHFMGQPGSSQQDHPGNNTYSLFSQSPWLPKSDNASHGSSPFNSASSSQSATPDPYSHDNTNYPPANPHSKSAGNVNPASMRWNNQSHRDANASNAGSLTVGNMPTLWSSGPTPLEKLLEQQKHHRHGDPPS